MHLIKDENGNLVSHGHEHMHEHTHSYTHSHAHSHEHGHEEDHEHSHDGHCHSHEEGHCHTHEDGHCHSHGEEHCGHCAHGTEENAQPADKMAALVDYMYKHNVHHAAELDQVAEKLCADGKDAVAEQIKKAVAEFEKGNLYLSLALSMLK